MCAHAHKTKVMGIQAMEQSMPLSYLILRMLQHGEFVVVCDCRNHSSPVHSSLEPDEEQMHSLKTINTAGAVPYRSSQNKPLFTTDIEISSVSAFCLTEHI